MIDWVWVECAHKTWLKDHVTLIVSATEWVWMRRSSNITIEEKLCRHGTWRIPRGANPSMGLGPLNCPPLVVAPWQNSRFYKLPLLVVDIMKCVAVWSVTGVVRGDNKRPICHNTLALTIQIQLPRSMSILKVEMIIIVGFVFCPQSRCFYKPLRANLPLFLRPWLSAETQTFTDSISTFTRKIHKFHEIWYWWFWDLPKIFCWRSYCLPKSQNLTKTFSNHRITLKSEVEDDEGPTAMFQVHESWGQSPNGLQL